MNSRRCATRSPPGARPPGGVAGQDHDDPSAALPAALALTAAASALGVPRPSPAVAAGAAGGVPLLRALWVPRGGRRLVVRDADGAPSPW